MRVSFAFQKTQKAENSRVEYSDNHCDKPIRTCRLMWMQFLSAGKSNACNQERERENDVSSDVFSLLLGLESQSTLSKMEPASAPVLV